MSEKSMSKIVMDALPGLDPIRVENLARPGTPDVNYGGWTEVPTSWGGKVVLHKVKVEGWIELKELDDWPVRPTTVVRVDHFRPEQKIWLRRRCNSGCDAWLLLKVRQEWLLLEGATAAKILGNVTREELERSAFRRWRTSAEMKDELVRCLSKS